MRVTKRLMAALLACLMLVSLLPVRVYAADAGKIALLAVTQDGYVIEPEYMTYHDGDTVKDVLKGSGHTFAGIDSGFITAVDGHVDNYSLHYDGDGYQLDAPAKGLNDGFDKAHKGFAVFNDLMEEYKPGWFVHGHIHLNYDANLPRVCTCGSTTVINATERYTFDIPDPAPRKKRSFWRNAAFPTEN